MSLTQVDDGVWKKLKADSDAKKEALTAETGAIDAETARIAARKKLSDAQAPPGADALAAAKAEQALAEAHKAQSEAELARFKAKVGEIPTSGIQGGVELGNKAGAMETALVAAKAMSLASATFATDIAAIILAVAETAARAEAANVGATAAADGAGATLPSPAAAIFVFPSGEAPDLNSMTDFRTFIKILSSEFVNALRSLRVASKEGLPGVGIGVALDAMSKILSFFRSDFKVDGTEMSADHAAFAELIAGKLRRELPLARIYLPKLYEQHAPSVSEEFFEKEFKPLEEAHQTALDALRDAETLSAQWTARLSALTGTTDEDKSGQKALTTKIGLIQAASDRLKKVDAAYGTLIDKLNTNGSFNALVRQYDLAKKFGEANAYVLITKVHKVGGTHYTKKNFWTLFGAMPFHVMGGVIISYSLFEAKTGNLVMSDMNPVHGGFKPVTEVGG